jgi:hypothetical protein
LKAVNARDYDGDGIARIKEAYVYEALAELKRTNNQTVGKLVGFAS